MVPLGWRKWPPELKNDKKQAQQGLLSLINITKTCLYNFDPLKPHFYIVKLGFTGVYIILLVSAQNIECGYSLEPHRWGGSNVYPQSMFWAGIWKNYQKFLSENFHFLVVKFSVHLNRRVFVMATYSFPEDASHGLLSLLVIHMVFFSCCCFTNFLLLSFAITTKQNGRL